MERARVADAAHAARSGESIDLSGLASGFSDRMSETWGRYAHKMRASQYRRAAEDIAAETEVHEAEAELHRTAQAYNRAKARVEEAKQARQRNER